MMESYKKNVVKMKRLLLVLLLLLLCISTHTDTQGCTCKLLCGTIWKKGLEEGEYFVGRRNILAGDSLLMGREERPDQLFQTENRSFVGKCNMIILHPRSASKGR